MSCMGGWCRNRDKCKHYEPKGVAIERLCETGDDDAYEPLIFTRAPGSWERKAQGLAPATWMEAVA